jgi:diacylglycerol O-acyltransferase / wax synthase
MSIETVELPVTAAPPATTPLPTAPSEPVSGVDFAWLRMDDPTNLMLVNGALVLHRPVERARVRALLENRFLPIPRFRQRLVAGRRGRPRWEPDPDFDLDRHLSEVQLPPPGGDAELREAIERLITVPLDRSYPLWGFHLLQGYKGGSVLLGRFHHAVGDGIALMLLLLSLTDLTPGLAEDPADSPFTALFCHTSPGLPVARAIAEQVMPEGMRLLLATSEAARRSGRLKTAAASALALARLILRPPDPKTLFRGPLGVAKRVAWSDALPLPRVKAVGRALSGTVNDVLLAAVAGGLRHYLEDRGQRVRGLSFRAAMPVNVRPLEEMAELGNRFGLVFLSLPVGIADPVERVAAVARRARALRRSAEPLVVYRILQLLGRVPERVQRLVVRLFAAKTTVVMTNMPGPRASLYLAGRPLDGVFFWVPQSGRVGMGISICSYAGEVRLGVATDAGLVPDPEAIVAGFMAEWEELVRRAESADGPASRAL